VSQEPLSQRSLKAQLFRGYAVYTFGFCLLVLLLALFEIMGLARHLCDQPEHKEIKDKVVADSTKKNKVGTFLAWLYQILEAAVVQEAAKFFKQQGYQIGALIFDGFMVEKREGRPVTRELLDSAADYAHEKTGYRVRLSEKSLEPLPEDTVRVLGPASSSSSSDISRKKLFLFVENLAISAPIQKLKSKRNLQQILMFSNSLNKHMTITFQG
jgi:hypothetical protein